MLQTLDPTTCSPEYSNVDFTKGGWGHRSSLAESPREAASQEGELDISRHFFPLAGGKFSYLILSLLALMVGLDLGPRLDLSSFSVTRLDFSWATACQEAPRCWAKHMPVGSALDFSLAYLFGSHVVASPPLVASLHCGKMLCGAQAVNK